MLASVERAGWLMTLARYLRGARRVASNTFARMVIAPYDANCGAALSGNPMDLDAAIAVLTPGRPLLIVDAEGVLLRFVDGFDAFLRSKGLFLDLTSYRLHGNIKRLANRRPVHDFRVNALLHEFHCTCDSLAAVDGAVPALGRLKNQLDVVVLSNITPGQGLARRRNLLALGLDLPLVVNEGLKGAAVKALSARAGHSFFIDDIPTNLASAATAAPTVTRIHLTGDRNLRGLLSVGDEADFRAEDWSDVEAFISKELKGIGAASTTAEV